MGAICDCCGREVPELPAGAVGALCASCHHGALYQATSDPVLREISWDSHHRPGRGMWVAFEIADDDGNWLSGDEARRYMDAVDGPRGGR